MTIKKYVIPSGEIYANEGSVEETFFLKGDSITLLPKQTYFHKTSVADAVHSIQFPAFWEGKKEFDKLIEEKGRIRALVDVSSADRWGDNLWLTIIPKAYKETYEEQIEIDVLVDTAMAAAWTANPHIHRLLLERPEAEEHDAVIEISGLEMKRKAQDGEFRSADEVLRKSGLYTVNKTPVYRTTPEERAWAEKKVKGMARPIIGVATGSRANVRRYPHMDDLVRILSDQGFSIILLDELLPSGKFRYILRGMGALVEQCDWVVAPDSGVLHTAGALKRRIIGIFGHTDGRVMMESYEKAIVVQGACTEGREACWWEVPCREGESYAEKEKADPPGCLEKLKPEAVLSVAMEEMEKVRKVFVLMLTYNLLEWTKVAIESIRSFHDLTLLVVDNESDDGTHDWLRSRGVDFVSKRCGVAEACNIGVKRFLESDCDYLFLVNNDVVLHYDTINSLVRTAEEKTDVSAITATEVEQTSPWYVDLVKAESQDFENIIDIGPGAYSCTLFRREIVEKVGVFDEAFSPRYIEDNDYTLRIRLAGGSFIKSKASLYYHALGAVVSSIEREKREKDFHWNKNIAYYTEKWGFHPHEHQSLDSLGVEWRKGRAMGQLKDVLKKKKVANVLITRNMGGAGDIIFTTAIARELKRKFKERIKIFYKIPPEFVSLLSNYPYIEKNELDAVADVSVDLTDVEFRVEMHEVAEFGEIKTPRTAIHLGVFGIESESIKPDYFPSDEELLVAEKRWSDKGEGKRVLVALRGSNPMRTWGKAEELARRLKSREDFSVIVSEESGTTLRELAALIAVSDLVVSPNSAPSNLAGAMNVPVVTIFSNYGDKPFTAMYESMIPVRGRCPIVEKGFCDYKAPCGGRDGPYRPKEMAVGEPECLQALEVETVERLVEKALER